MYQIVLFLFQIILSEASNLYFDHMNEPHIEERGFPLGCAVHQHEDDLLLYWYGTTEGLKVKIPQEHYR